MRGKRLAIALRTGTERKAKRTRTKTSTTSVRRSAQMSAEDEKECLDAKGCSPTGVPGRLVLRETMVADLMRLGMLLVGGMVEQMY